MPARAELGLFAEEVVRIRWPRWVAMICAGLGALAFVCSYTPAQVAQQIQDQEKTGSIAGRVVLEGVGAGVRKVVVQLIKTSAPGAEDSGAIGANPEAAGQIFETSTDADGRFRIEGVSAGNYTVLLRRNGFLRSDTKENPSITLAPGQELSGLSYKMLMAGVITGKITDTDGDPLLGVSVWVMRVGRSGSEFDAEGRESGEAGQETTNDLGEYRIAGLRPGKYVVQAQAHGLSPAPDLAEKGKQREKATYALTFFPGTADVKTAAPVEVAAGGIATANFGVVTSRTYHVSGTVTMAGNPRNVQMFLVSTTGQTDAVGLGEGGKFEFTTVLPGTYAAQIVDMAAGTDNGPPTTHTQMIGSPIVVSNADISGLVLQPEAGGSVTGKLRSEDGTALTWTDLTVSLVRLPQEDELPQLAEIGALGGNAQVKEDGSFEFRDVAGSTYWVVLGSNSDKFRDFYLKSVQLDGREVVDTGFAVNGPVTVDVVMSAKGGTVDGTVVNGDGDGVPNVSVVSLPSSGKAARVDYYQVEKTDSTGHFVMRGMNPGAYVLVAVDGTPRDPRSADFFTKYAPKGETVDLAEGDRQSVVVKMEKEKE